MIADNTNQNPNTLGSVSDALLATGERLFVSRGTQEVLGTPLRLATFRYWNHAYLLRRHTEAAKLAASAERIVDLEFSRPCTDPLAVRCREVRKEMDEDRVERYPQAV